MSMRSEIPSRAEYIIKYKGICFSDRPLFLAGYFGPKQRPAKKLTKTTAVNINKASKNELVNAFRGSGVKRKTLDKLIELRDNRPCKNLDDLIAYLGTTENVKKKLQEKLDNNEICF